MRLSRKSLAIFRKLGLEREFERGLHESRRCCFDDLTELSAVTISIDGRRSEKLRVIVGIEAFQSELQRL